MEKNGTYRTEKNAVPNPVFIRTLEKAKVVAAVWGTEMIQFLAKKRFIAPG